MDGHVPSIFSIHFPLFWLPPMTGDMRSKAETQCACNQINHEHALLSCFVPSRQIELPGISYKADGEELPCHVS